MLFFTDTFDGRTYGPFPSVAVAHEYMAEIGYVSPFPTFEADSCDGAIAPAAGWMAEALRITQAPAAPAAPAAPKFYSVKLSETIRNEWLVRCIGDVIPELEGACWNVPVAALSADTVRAIAADARWMMDPRNVDTYPGERAAYRALAAQCAKLGF